MNHVFSTYLEKEGVSSSRCEELFDAFYKMEKALAALDHHNRLRVVHLGGVQGLLEKFADLEEVAHVGRELREVQEVHAATLEELPGIMFQMRSRYAKELAEDRLKERQ
jgi:hypothetical protein